MCSNILLAKVSDSGKSGTWDCLEIPESQLTLLKMLEWWNSVESYLYCGFSDHFGLTLAPPNSAPVAEALIGPYIIIFSGAILGGAKYDLRKSQTSES